MSIVVYQSDNGLLTGTLVSLWKAITYAQAHNSLLSTIYIVDNGCDTSARERILSLIDEVFPSKDRANVLMFYGHGNIGYGEGHNLAWSKSLADYHLILNPDVELEQDSLLKAINFLEQDPTVGLLAPAVRDPKGYTQYLCRRYPTVMDLLLRGFAPKPVRYLFHNRLSRYELQDVIGRETIWDVPLSSGCFMMLRRSVLGAVNGFDPAYFLYFEDYDLSLRVARVSRSAYVPTVRIVHHGGQAARKGIRHVWLFTRSAIRFFNRHGWAFL